MWMAKKGLALLPVDDKCVRALRKLEDGEAVEVELKRSRSPSWHRFFMKCCAVIGDHQEPVKSTHQMKEAIKMAAGHVETLISPNGTEYKFAKSIAFDKLTPDEWEELWPSLEDAMRLEFRFDTQLFKDGYAGFYE